MVNHTLVINLSLSSIKILIFDEKGKKNYEDWLPVRTFIDGASVEQDPNEWWELLTQLLRKVFQDKRFNASIKTITVTSSAMCLVFLDKKGDLLTRSYMVSDKRASLESEILREKFSPLFTEHHSWKADPSFMIPKIFWTKRHEKKIVADTAYYLSSNDFLLYKLTGKILTDSLNAEKFYYNTSAKSYSKEILSYVGISENSLPKVVDPGTVAGSLKKEIASLLGIQNDITVTIGTYDAICAFIGSSTYLEGELNNVCGTCSSYRIFVKNPQLPETSKLLVQEFPGETYIVGGSNNLEGGVLEWAKECFYSDNMRDNTFLYDLMQAEAQESEIGANGLLFIPYLIGERLPFSDAYVRGMFFGIERYHTRKDIIRSVMEANGFQSRLMIEEFEKSGIPIASVNISGGGAKLEYVSKLRADILGMPVNVLAEVETTALGAFILSQKAHGKIKTIKEAKEYVHFTKQYLPNMHNHNSYSSLFILFKELYTTNASFFKKRREVFNNIMHYQKKILENL